MVLEVSRDFPRMRESRESIWSGNSRSKSTPRETPTEPAGRGNHKNLWKQWVLEVVRDFPRIRESRESIWSGNSRSKSMPRETATERAGRGNHKTYENYWL